MAVYNLTPLVCSACRISHYEKGKETQCDIDGICSKTHNYANDEDELMILNQEEKDVVYLWDRIVNISRLEMVQKSRDKKNVDTYYLKTLDKIDFVLENTNWGFMSITKEEAISYVALFHMVYNNSIMG